MIQMRGGSGVVVWARGTAQEAGEKWLFYERIWKLETTGYAECEGKDRNQGWLDSKILA